MFEDNIYLHSLINNPAEFDIMPSSTEGYYNFDVQIPVLDSKQDEKIETFVLKTVRQYGGLYYAHNYNLMNNPTLEVWGFLLPTDENIEEIEKIITSSYSSSRFYRCKVM